MNAFTFAHIALEDIDDTARYSLHPFLVSKEISDELKTSVTLCGILTPPTVAVKTGGGYELICGRQRLLCASTILDDGACHCRVAPETTDIEDILACVIEDQFAAGGLGIMEQAVFMSLCHDLIDDPGRRERFIHSLPPRRITKGSRFLLQLSQLDDRLKRAVHTGIVSERILGDLQFLAEDDRLGFASLVEELGLGGNQQRKLLSQLADICARQGIGLDGLLRQDSLRTILEDPHSSTSRKGNRFVQAVGRMSQPALTGASESFAAEVRALNLPERCALSPSPSFEKDEVHFSARFANLRQFQDFWKMMGKTITEM